MLLEHKCEKCELELCTSFFAVFLEVNLTIIEKRSVGPWFGEGREAPA